MYFRTKGLKSAKKAIKCYILATLKITPIYKQFLGKIDGGPIRNTSKNFGQKVFLIGALYFFQIEETKKTRGVYFEFIEILLL